MSFTFKPACLESSDKFIVGIGDELCMALPVEFLVIVREGGFSVDGGWEVVVDMG